METDLSDLVKLGYYLKLFKEENYYAKTVYIRYHSQRR